MKMLVNQTVNKTPQTAGRVLTELAQINGKVQILTPC